MANYILQTYPIYQNIYRNNNELKFTDVFKTNPLANMTGKKVVNIDATIKNAISLRRLIAYAVYVTAPKIMNNATAESLERELIKQIKKDVVRNKIIIDGIAVDPHGETAGTLYGQVGKNFWLLMLLGQYLYNMLVILIITAVKETLEENCIISGKSLLFNINTKAATITVAFHATLAISTNQDINLEYPCGNMHYVFFANTTDRTYEFRNFHIDYDLTKCNVQPPGPPIEPKIDASANDAAFLPVAIGMTAIAVAPFILASLGGGKTKIGGNNMQYPTQKAMLGANPRDSAIVAMKNNNASQARANASLSGGKTWRQSRRRRTRRRQSRRRRTRRRRRIGGAITVPQYQMPYTPQGGPGTNPNDQITTNSTTSTQQAANNVYDKNATQMGGGYSSNPHDGNWSILRG